MNPRPFVRVADARLKLSMILKEMDHLIARAERERRGVLPVAEEYIPKVELAMAEVMVSLENWRVAVGGRKREASLHGPFVNLEHKAGPFTHPERGECEVYVGDYDLLGSGVVSSGRLGKGYDDGLNEGLERSLRYPVFLAIGEALTQMRLTPTTVKEAVENGLLSPKELLLVRELGVL